MQRFILTVGPSLLHEVPLEKIHDKKNIYRINGAHGDIESIEGYIEEIRRQIPDADILMDLPGNKVRTKNLPNGEIHLEEGKMFSIPSECFNYVDFYKHITPGMITWANDSIFKFEVVEVNAKEIQFKSYSTGTLINNKGVHIRGIHDNIPYLFEKDKQLIQVANKYGISFVGLSFVRKPEDVLLVKDLIDKNTTEIITKIETLDAVNRINEILPLTKFILVDRGDLSTDVGLLNIPRYQRYIIEKANYNNVNVFLATQVLKNMELNPIPTIGETEALYNIFKTGVYGVQMSEETAVGKNVVECVNVLNEMDKLVNAERITQI